MSVKKEDSEKLEELMRVHKFTQEGYAGILPNGNIVDIREFPNAIPILENGLLGVPKPKKREDGTTI